MKIVAFLQNMWAYQPDRIVLQRRKLIRRLLFAGCLTGKRLKDTFGDELCQLIVWENASPIIGNQANSNPQPDIDHIKLILEEEQPDLVIAFGVRARIALDGIWKGKLIVAPHPAARGKYTMRNLRQAGKKVLEIVIKENMLAI